MREGRSPQQLGKKGKHNRRWIVGIKLCWLVNDRLLGPDANPADRLLHIEWAL
jgi:hypothetical protein